MINKNQLNDCIHVGDVLSTKNYEVFKILEGNRIIDAKHVQDLKESMSQYHGLNPIIVNENYEIIDGQNRYIACKELGLPVYFLIEEGANLETVKIYNTNVKNWSRRDHLESLVSQGSEPAKRIIELSDKFNVQPATVVTAAGKSHQLLNFNNVNGGGNKGERTGYMYDWLTDETFSAEDSLKAERGLNKASVVISVFKESGIPCNVVLYNSLAVFLNTTESDPDRLIDPIKKYSKLRALPFSGDRPTVGKTLCQIYNYRRKSNFVDYTKKKGFSFGHSENKWNI